MIAFRLHAVTTPTIDPTTYAVDAATPVEGSYVDRTQGSTTAKTVRCHKAQKTGLTSGTTYSYRVGGADNYVYGTFKVNLTDRPLTVRSVGAFERQPPTRRASTSRRRTAMRRGITAAIPER